MVKIDISTEASIALEESTFWYENQAPGLGMEFLSDFEQSLIRIQSRPKLFPFFRPPLRKCIGRRFPYVVLYVFDESLNHIFITGFWHQKQDY